MNGGRILRPAQDRFGGVSVRCMLTPPNPDIHHGNSQRAWICIHTILTNQVIILESVEVDNLYLKGFVYP
jgi:hypothetical protein